MNLKKCLADFSARTYCYFKCSHSLPNKAWLAVFLKRLKTRTSFSQTLSCVITFFRYLSELMSQKPSTGIFIFMWTLPLDPLPRTSSFQVAKKSSDNCLSLLQPI